MTHIILLHHSRLPRFQGRYPRYFAFLSFLKNIVTHWISSVWKLVSVQICLWWRCHSLYSLRMMNMYLDWIKACSASAPCVPFSRYALTIRSLALSINQWPFWRTFDTFTQLNHLPSPYHRFLYLISSFSIDQYSLIFVKLSFRWTYHGTSPRFGSKLHLVDK